MNHENTVTIVWTSADREVALKMAFMYAQNAKLEGWWENVRLIVWGPSARLLSQDLELQERVRLMLHVGVIVEACKACSDQYGVSNILEALEIKVKYVGMDFTEILKEGGKVLTI